jgi:hypothetical protein
MKEGNEMKSYDMVDGYVLTGKSPGLSQLAPEHNTDMTEATLDKINGWVSRLSGMSAVIGSPPEIIKEFAKDGRIKVELIAELSDFGDFGYYAYIVDGKEVAYAMSCGEAEITKLAGFSDIRGEYVCHAYLPEEEWRELRSVHCGERD